MTPQEPIIELAYGVIDQQMHKREEVQTLRKDKEIINLIKQLISYINGMKDNKNKR